MNNKALLALSFIPGVGNQRLRALLEHFKDPADAFEASPAELKRIPGIDTRTAQAIAGYDQSSDGTVITSMLNRLEQLNGHIITINDTEYPPSLKQIYDPPAYLYMLGAVEESDHDAIAIVGTREPTEYGKSVTENLCTALVQAGLTIVSGMARGIDTVAHTTALQAGGRTIAVIGSGIDIIYPQDNVRLSRQIKERGAILSEYHIGTKPDAGNFPKRNRIISGMTLGTVIIESSETGGAMITASYALDHNREVFAVPGAIYEKQSRGTNKLIKGGRAKLVISPEDIVEEIASRFKYIQSEIVAAQSTLPTFELNMFEQKIFDVLSKQPTHIDIIAEQAGLSTSDTLVHLLALEFKGAVKQLAGKMFCHR